MTVTPLNAINYRNSLLILLTAMLAWYIPLDLFLIAYAVLGPLHYLTELSWLHDKQYYSRGNTAPIALGVIAVLLTLAFIFSSPLFALLIFVALVIAAAGSTKITGKQTAIAVVCAAVGASFLYQQYSFQLLMAMYLPTLIHVALFTFIFMLLGSLKEHSQSGYFSCYLYMVALLGLTIGGNPNTPFVIDTAELGAFSALAESIALNLHQASHPSVINNFALETALRIMAFTYTYHYLNWFSKTRILKWHQMPARRAKVIFACWLIAIALYAYDYQLGIATLFFLSILHVLLEFPLNIISIKQTVSLLRVRLKI